LREVFDHPFVALALVAAGVLSLALLGVMFVRRRRAMAQTNTHRPHVEGRSTAVCFMDESGTDDATLEDAAVGGFITNWRLVPEFNQHWSKMLEEHDVAGGLHMRELAPRKRLSHISGERKYWLLKRAVGLINEYRIFTMAAVVNNKTYHATMQPTWRHR
jgi:hypothetical protein